MKKIAEMEAIIAVMKEDAEKFFTKENASAGPRVRKQCQAIKVLCNDLRKEVQDVKEKRAK